MVVDRVANEWHDNVLVAAQELNSAKTVDEVCRRAVELGRESLGLDRLGVLLYDSASKEMIGTWGTDAHGKVVNESGSRQPVPLEEGYLAEGLSRNGYLTVWEDRDLTNWGTIVGRGWNALAVLREGDDLIGWLAVDNLLLHKPLGQAARGQLVLYAQIIANLINRMRQNEALENGIGKRTSELLGRVKTLTLLYEEANAKNSLKDRLFTILAHDLHGPMGTLRDFLAEILERNETFSEQELRSYIPEMHKSVNSVYDLIANLLDWVRSQIDEIKVLRERIFLDELFLGVIATQAATARAKGVSIAIIPGAAVSAFADRRMVEAIVRNFLSNGVKFTLSGKKVTLSARHSVESMMTYLDIADEGLGMDEKALETLFTLDNAKKRSGTSGEIGSGIGLIFSLDLAKRLGGNIEVRSRPGEGSVFTLSLPDIFEGDLPAAE